MNDRYALPARFFHWAIALIIFCAFPVGLLMGDLESSPFKLKLFSWHKWAGITVLVLAILRLLWRLGHHPPQLPSNLPRWQHRASALAHGMLYFLIFAVPMTGWLQSSAKGFSVVWFGVLALPDLVSKNKELAELFGNMHAYLNYFMAAIVVLHVAAALKHHFIDKDTVLRRML